MPSQRTRFIIAAVAVLFALRYGSDFVAWHFPKLSPRYYRCIGKARSIKSGADREKLEKIFYPDGGANYGTVYQLSGCSSCFKGKSVMVRVKFQPSGSKEILYGPVKYGITATAPLKVKQSRYARDEERDDDILIEISKPFLGKPLAD